MEQIFIYLIIFVVMILFSARQNKKKQQAAKQAMLKKQQSPQPQQQPATIEDIFKKLGSESIFSSESNLSPAAYMPQESGEPQFLSFEESIHEVKKSEKRLVKKKQREDFFPDEIVVSEINDQRIDFQFDNPDEMRKAIIYSEIINRKYE